MALLSHSVSCRLNARTESRRSVVTCSASQERSRQPLDSAKAAAAGLLLAASLCAGEVSAKVILEKPAVKKFYQSDATAEPVKKAEPQPGTGTGVLPSLPSLSAPKLPSLPEGGGLPKLGLDLGLVAIPGAIASIVGGGFLLSKIDPGFGAMLRETIIKDSGDYAGYEEELKSGGDPAKKSKTGTKAIKAARGPQAKPGEGPSFGLPKLPNFGK